MAGGGETLPLPFGGRRRARRDVFPLRAPWVDQPRLTRQCRLILERLRQGPASNRELSRLALKYTGRLSDLRRAGYVVTIVRQDHVTGEVIYELREGADGSDARVGD